MQAHYHDCIHNSENITISTIVIALFFTIAQLYIVIVM